MSNKNGTRTACDRRLIHIDIRDISQVSELINLPTHPYIIHYSREIWRSLHKVKDRRNNLQQFTLKLKVEE